MKEGTIVIENNHGAVAQGEKAVAIGMPGTNVFQPGDTVELKSGSPIMTVTDVGGGMIHCVWFRGKESNTGCFPAIALLHKMPAWRKE